jgi:hypothetical protein
MNGHRFAFSYGISYRVPGLDSFIQLLHHLPLLRSSSVFPCPLYSHSSIISLERWLTMVSVGSGPAMKILAAGHAPPPPRSDAYGVGRSLGECGKEVSVRLSFAIGERIY